MILSFLAEALTMIYVRGPFKRFDDWKIAVLMNAIHETEAGGKIIRCKLDVQSKLR